MGHFETCLSGRGVAVSCSQEKWPTSAMTFVATERLLMANKA